jgi:hypothetical protein
MLTGRHQYGIATMRMKQPYPGATYDPAQCRFWPAVFRQNGYHTAQTAMPCRHRPTTCTKLACRGMCEDEQDVWLRPSGEQRGGLG